MSNRNPRPITYTSKVCCRCRNEFPLESFYKNKVRSGTNTSYYSSWCKECNREFNRGTNKARRFELKMLVLKAYGGDPPVCACCPIDEPSRSEPSVLTIDHIIPALRKSNSARKDCGAHLYEYLRDNNFPPGFRVLCFNCNCSSSRNRICHHEERRRRLAMVAD